MSLDGTCWSQHSPSNSAKVAHAEGVKNRAWQEKRYLQMIRPSAILLVQGERQKLQTKKQI
jgi:hypothetical protein